MGKPTGFIEYLRELPLDRPAVERILPSLGGIIEPLGERVIRGKRKSAHDATADRNLQAVVVPVIALIAEIDIAVSHPTGIQIHHFPERLFTSSGFRSIRNKSRKRPALKLKWRPVVIIVP